VKQIVLIGGSSGIVGIRVLTTAVEPVVTFILDAARDLLAEFEADLALGAAGRGRGSAVSVSEGAETSTYPSQEPFHFKQFKHDGFVSSHLTCRFL
jgi:hypothetical protein